MLKLKTSDFQLHTRRLSLCSGTDDGQTVYRHALALLADLTVDRPVRLTGVSVTNLEDAPVQLPLLDLGEKRAQRLNLTLDAIASRFGSSSIRPADLVEMDVNDGPLDEVRAAMGAPRVLGAKGRTQ